MTLFATAQAIGLPPKVDPCVPVDRDGAISFFVNVAQIGIHPPKHFAEFKISVSMSYFI